MAVPHQAPLPSNEGVHNAGHFVSLTLKTYNMRKTGLVCSLWLALAACSGAGTNGGGNARNTVDPDTLFARYWEERMQLFPFEATANGDNRYNDRMTITISGGFRDSLGRFYQKYLDQVRQVDTAVLDVGKKMSCRLFRYEMEMGLEGLKYPSHLVPMNQFWSFTLELGQLGSGQGNQPFRQLSDYDKWLKRMETFPAWADTAIANMRQGIAKGWVLPRPLVLKMLPQLKSMTVRKDNLFYSPAKSLPDSFPAARKAELEKGYARLVDSIVVPAYSKLYDFLEKEYLPAARSSSGINAVPGGSDYYRYCIRQWTTTDLSPDSIYNLGLREVSRIEGEMNAIREQTGFTGDLQAFFKYLSEDRQFYPFSTPQQVLDSFWNIKKLEDPQLGKIFNRTPKTQFTIRQTEAFRAASASAEYNPGAADGSRPGIFYVPILDAKKFNAVGMNTLFLHEAIPGHHYQISLQQEDQSLPQFRRFLWYGAYGEGWALYSETLGKQLGVYDNPYQYFGHLSDAMHRAIRLVVDVGMHHKGMSREEAIAYMTQHERISKEEATAEIERYMALPGQALSYKIGQLTISGLRQQYEQQLGNRFRLASFHDEVLKDGCVPLEILKEKLQKWAASQ